MSNFDFDFFVIGGGSGGVRAARVAASLGARVAIAENDRYGGTCVIRGCIPKKLLVYASHFANDFSDAEAYGWSLSSTSFSWQKLIAAKNKEIARLSQIYQDLLTSSGVTLLNGLARFVDTQTVELNGKKISAKYILIATGGKPYRPSIPGIEFAITSDEAFDLPRLPRRMVIVGGGYIAVEFAGIFNGLGVETVLVYRGDQILRGFDDDLRLHLAAEMTKKGIEIKTKSDISTIERSGDGVRVTLENGERIGAGQIMFATGRIPHTLDLGLHNAGLEPNQHGAVPVDAYSQTAVANIYAVGDVTNRVNLTPVAIREGHGFADTVFGHKPTKVDHALVPSAVFSQPELGTVGLTEVQARAAFPKIDIYKTTFRPMKHTLSGRDERMLMKLVVDGESDRVLGCHISGSDAGEMAQLLGIAITCGATKAQFDATLAVHPTASEELVTMRDKSTA